MFKNLYKSLSLFVAMLLLSTAAHAEHHGMKKDIADVAVENGSFTTLVAALKAAGLVDTLNRLH